MSIPPFQTFFPTVSRWLSARWRQEYRLILDNDTAVPIGIVNQNANGAQGIWGLTPLSQDQISSPSAGILADLNATYQLNESPYSRYRSTGSELLPLDASGGVVIPPGVIEVLVSPLTITADNSPFEIQGGIRLIE
jgi:hypothetical protein